MKFLNKLAAIALAMGMAACSSDEPAVDNGGNQPSDNGFYSKITLKLPATGRSTEKDGEEVGQDYENKVGAILVVLATKGETDTEYKYLTYAKTDAPANSSNTYTIVFQDKEKLFSQAGKTVYAFAYCNPTSSLVSKITALSEGDSFENLLCDSSSEVESTWLSNGFLMTSVQVLEKELADEATLKTYNTPANAYPLGKIEVIRTASRFDFRDASEGDLTYTVRNEDAEVAEGTEKPAVAKIKMLNVAMVNERGQFFYLPRNTTNGLCPTFNGMESGLILTPSTATFTQQLLKADGAYAPLAHGNDAYKALSWTSLSSIVNGTEDNDNTWNDGNKFEKGYHIWRYTSENTPYASAADAAKIPTPDNTTGFVFEAEIIPDATAIPEGISFTSGTDIMYVYANKLYVNKEHIYNVIKEAPHSGLADAFNACFDVTEAEGNVTVTKKADADLKANGLTEFAPDATDKKYYTYYFGYNRHNDNEDITETGEMEFATVRNNVYKLAVTKVMSFGGFTPGQNIEDWDVYFNLEVLVRNWVVRVNNIEF